MKNTQEIVRVVDDNNDQREALVFMLQTEGYEVQSYASAKAFLAGNMPSVPGVLILDLQMPEMNGLELQAELNRQGSTLPVIFLSAHGDLPQAVKAMKQGSCDFLEKPAEADLLLETVAKVLERDRIVRGAGITPRIAQLRLQRLSARELDVARLLAKGECQQFCVSLISLINRWLVKILGKSFTVHHSHFFHGCCPSW